MFQSLLLGTMSADSLFQAFASLGNGLLIAVVSVLMYLAISYLDLFGVEN